MIYQVRGTAATGDFGVLRPLVAQLATEPGCSIDKSTDTVYHMLSSTITISISTQVAAGALGSFIVPVSNPASSTANTKAASGKPTNGHDLLWPDNCILEVAG